MILTFVVIDVDKKTNENFDLKDEVGWDTEQNMADLTKLTSFEWWCIIPVDTNLNMIQFNIISISILV